MSENPWTWMIEVQGAEADWVPFWSLSGRMFSNEAAALSQARKLKERYPAEHFRAAKYVRERASGTTY